MDMEKLFYQMVIFTKETMLMGNDMGRLIFRYTFYFSKFTCNRNRHFIGYQQDTFLLELAFSGWLDSRLRILLYRKLTR